MAMERNTLYRKLMKLIGQSPSQFIRSIRLKRAAQLLNQNAFSIGEIVYMVGFEKHSYFTDCFKKQFGVPPSAFKAKKI
jgi:AraC-like DNA-binding protein